MIKTGIVGAHNPIGGELIRILINHPEIELISLYAPLFPGRNASSIHPGLIGENIGNFTENLVIDDLDLLFITEKGLLNKGQIAQINDQEDLKVIFLNGDFSTLNPLPEVGLSEINRKALVRGATRAQVLDAISATILISLYPLAKYMLLNTQLQIRVSVPENFYKEFEGLNNVITTVRQLLQQYQPSFIGNILINVYPDSDDSRGLTVDTDLECNLSLEEIEKIYDSIYDDHNFTFTTFSPIATNEVVGTQKCVISLSKTLPSKLNVKAVSDIRMRGGAGDAVHVMNLLLGLHEKTGLTMKTSRFGIINQ